MTQSDCLRIERAKRVAEKIDERWPGGSSGVSGLKPVEFVQMAKQQLTTLSRELNEAYMRKAWFLWNTLLHQVVPPQDNEEAFVGRIALTLALADRPPTADDMIGYPRESINQSPEGLAKLHEHLRKERNLSDAELPTPDELAETFRKEIEEKAIPKFQRTVREEKYRNGSRLTPFSMR